MDDRDRRRWLAEYWPLFVGAAIIVVGNVYLYGIRGAEWTPAGPPLLVALGVVFLIELGRAIRRRLGHRD
jgi:hypothetical protein